MILLATYAALLSLFAEWREFVRSIHDYSPPAIARQREKLHAFQRRLGELHPESWTIPQQVDYRIVKAELSGMDFDQRVLKPWERDPAFYVTVFTDDTDQPAREGPHANADLPIPALLAQARKNLTGDARDLWIYGIRDVKAQLAALKPGPDRDATQAFVDWLEQQAPRKRGPSGIGVSNYDWYLANVQLVPWTWREEVALMEAELARSRAMLALEEQRNRGLPEQEPRDADFAAAVREYMKLLETVLTIKPWMEPALLARVPKTPPRPPLEFFSEVDYRDPVLMRTHGYHWIDLARMKEEPNPDPIRRGALLYNIFDTRTEGFATAMEELMMTLGLCDKRPRSRELVYVLLAERAARALGDLHIQSNEWTLEQAAKFASENTPRGWLRLSGETVWGEQHLYLQQPAYGTSYLIGKLEMENILARWRGTLREYMDRKDAAGLIPASLLRWELTGVAPK